jgi:small subunit ribosomal protein S16
MLKIRLQRTGRTNDPSFRIVVVEHTESTKSGNFIERVGTYNPKTKQKNLIADRIKYWLSVGAKASGTVHNMLVSAGIISGEKVNVLPKKSLPAVSATAAQAGPPEKDDGGTTAAAVATATTVAATAEEESKTEETVLSETPIEATVQADTSGGDAASVDATSA